MPWHDRVPAGSERHSCHRRSLAQGSEIELLSVSSHSGRRISSQRATTVAHGTNLHHNMNRHACDVKRRYRSCTEWCSNERGCNIDAWAAAYCTAVNASKTSLTRCDKQKTPIDVNRTEHTGGGSENGKILCPPTTEDNGAKHKEVVAGKTRAPATSKAENFTSVTALIEVWLWHMATNQNSPPSVGCSAVQYALLVAKVLAKVLVGFCASTLSSQYTTVFVSL